ncbi:hypothetical protein [Shinella zoogloeoides]|uniref:hypothetical protein n=1 Tax=Shinella zoogloeoides TaxID=352475 RepID=UPI00273DBFBD|nr:hypothetical protein [Shinella zoogloeoides]WLR94854.1 hypothetical protein Q9316_14205 [Shinella zoogloeoides]
MGEIINAMTALRAGNPGRLMPSAASVPRSVASAVLKTAATTLFKRLCVQRGFSKKSEYQRHEYSWIGKVKNGSFETDNGNTTKSGPIRKTRTAKAKVTTAKRQSRSLRVA